MYETRAATLFRPRLKACLEADIRLSSADSQRALNHNAIADQPLPQVR